MKDTRWVTSSVWVALVSLIVTLGLGTLLVLLDGARIYAAAPRSFDAASYPEVRRSAISSRSPRYNLTRENGVTKAVRSARASDDVGESNLSTSPIVVDNVLPNESAVLTPSLPVCRWVNTSTLNMQWGGFDDELGIAGYQYLISDTGLLTLPLPGGTFATVTSTTEALDEGEWYFHVAAQGSGSCIWSTTAYTGPFYVDIQEPHNVAITAPEHISATQFTVSWSAEDTTTGIASYTVEYSGTAYTTWQAWLTGVTSTEAVFNAPASETNYIFRVTAYDRAGNNAQATTTTRVGAFNIHLPLVLRGYPEVGVIRVAPGGTDAPGCGFATSPCRTIQYAVNLAESGNTIKVADGTYTYSGDTPHDDCSLLSTRPPVVCVLNKHLTLVGGYSINNWTTSDPAANPTIIDGQDWYRGIMVVGWSKTENLASLEMKGFTIKRGLAKGGTSGAYHQVCGYGGGLFAYKASVTLEDLVFASNKAVGGDTAQTYGGYGVGGGLAIDTIPPGAICSLEDLTFDSNEAVGGSGRDRGGIALGGGLSVYGTVVNANRITFTNNVAKAGNSSGNGVDTVYGITADALGGGAAINTGSQVTLQHIAAIGNQAIGGDAGTQGSGDRAGAAHGGALYSEKATMDVLDSDIRENLVRSGDATNSYVAGGGGIMGINSEVTVRRSTIIGNTARGGNGTTGQSGSAGGGGVYLARFSTDTTVSIVNSIIADNYAERGSLGLESGGGGGGLWLQGVDVDIVHTTIARNRLGPNLFYGQAVLLLNQGAPTPTIADISYSIIADHADTTPNPYLTQAALHAFAGNTVNLHYGLFANNDKNTNSDGSPGPSPGGTFNGLDTMLSAGSAGFIAPGSPDYDYHILANSAAKDQATGSTTSLDIDGQSRPYNGVSDIGADEYR